MDSSPPLGHAYQVLLLAIPDGSSEKSEMQVREIDAFVRHVKERMDGIRIQLTDVALIGEAKVVLLWT